MDRRPLNLYKVRVDTHMCVLAHDQSEAKGIALDSILMELEERPQGLNIICEIKNMGAIPPGWMDLIPFAGHAISRFLEGRSVGEFVRHQLWKPFNKKKGTLADDSTPGCYVGK